MTINNKSDTDLIYSKPSIRCLATLFEFTEGAISRRMNGEKKKGAVNAALSGTERK